MLAELNDITTFEATPDHVNSVDAPNCESIQAHVRKQTKVNN